MNMVSSSRIGGRRQLAAWGWGRVSRRRGEEQGVHKKSSAVQLQAPLQHWMEAWAGDFELDPSSREGLSGPNSNQIGTGRSVRRR